MRQRIAQPGVTVMIHAPLPESAAGLHDAHVGMAGYNDLLYQASANLSACSGVKVVAEIAGYSFLSSIYSGSPPLVSL